MSPTAPNEGDERFTRTLELGELGGATLYASPRQMTLGPAIAELKVQILKWGGLVLLIALALGFWFARRLARPIVELSLQARAILEGEPKPIRTNGGPELRQFADSVNRTLEDLARLRSRLAVTERVAAQREIARRVAHEIKNPLAPIRAAIETLRRLRARNDPAFDTIFDESTRTVLSEVQRIATIVGEFTEFARLPAPRPQHFDLEPSVASVVQLHQTEGVSLRLTTEGPTTIRADRDQCVQVVTNLLQNALDAVRGRSPARIEVGLRNTGNYIELSVDDSGAGVPQAQKSAIFEPYRTTKPHGTGLGLSIVQRIAIEHGGEVSVGDSALGGARFLVTLPVDGPAVVLGTGTQGPVALSEAQTNDAGGGIR